MSDTHSSAGASLPDVSHPRNPKRRRARHNKSRKGCYTCKLRRVKVCLIAMQRLLAPMLTELSVMK